MTGVLAAQEAGAPALNGGDTGLSSALPEAPDKGMLLGWGSAAATQGAGGSVDPGRALAQAWTHPRDPRTRPDPAAPGPKEAGPSLEEEGRQPGPSVAWFSARFRQPRVSSGNLGAREELRVSARAQGAPTCSC